MREPVTYALRLVNPSEDTIMVLASAGAARVVLDTLPAGDSVRLNVRLRSDVILLEGSDLRGGRVGSTELLLEPDSLNRWEALPAPGGARDPGSGPRS